MKKQTNPNIKAHLVRGVFYLLLLMAVCVVPFALGQRTTNKQSALADPLLLGSTPLATLPASDAPASGTWILTGSLNTARFQHTANLLTNGKVLVAGGFNSTYTASSELYRRALGTWTATGSLNIARNNHTGTLLPSGKVLVAGGISPSGFAASTELYDPASGSWTFTGSLNNARFNHTATLLPNGMVLVAAGLLFDSSGSSAELYDPASGTWTATGNLNNPGRDSSTATLLPNGKVLVAGGRLQSSSGPPSTSAELYDPASGTWTATGSLNTARYLHTANLLPNGKVLVAGGYDNTNGGALASPELN